MKIWVNFSRTKTCFNRESCQKGFNGYGSKSDLALKHFNIDKGYKVILVIGGSLGAKSINEGLLASLDILKNQTYSTHMASR